MLLPLGIEKGKEFKPDPATVALLRTAAAEAVAWLNYKAVTDTTPWWPNSQWCLPSLPITVPIEFKWEMPGYFDVEARGIGLAQYFCPTAKLGTGSFYFGAFHDHSGEALEGRKTIDCACPLMFQCANCGLRLSIVSKTSSFFLNATRLTLSSLDKELRKNGEGTVDIYFGPSPPASSESNWLYTQPGQKWFTWFRVYGPEKSILDKSWRLPDIEMAS
jgi:hypothetical protein